MIYLKLFLSFLKIGAFSFGGGMGMISLLRDTVLSQGWMKEEELLNFIAVSESTPGPIAVNMATFVGVSQGGIFGGLAATLGVVLPSFFIILLIASIFANLTRHKVTQGVMAGIRPAIVGMVLATAVIMGLSTLFSYKTMGNHMKFRWQETVIFIILILASVLCKKFWKKKPTPIVMILLSAILGIIVYF